MIKKYLDNFKDFPREIWILTLMTFINRAGTMVVPFLSKYLKDSLGFSYSQIGWIMVCFGVGSFVGTWLSGKLSDKIGFYKVMIFSLFTSGIIFFCLQFISSFLGLCAAILILTSIADMFRPAMLVSLNTYTRKENRTRALTLIRSAVNLGFLFGPLLGGLIIMYVGYSYLFLVDGATCIVAVLVFVTFVKEKKLPFKLKANTIVVGDKLAIIKDKPFLMHLFITMVTGILFFQIFTTLPLYHKEHFHLSEFYSGTLLSMNGLLIMLFELPIVNYVERKKINKLIVICFGILSMVVGYWLLVMVQHWVGILYIMMLFMTFGVMLTFPFANSFAMSRVHKSQEGKYMSVFTMSYSIAHILSAKTGMEIIQDFGGYKSNWIFMASIGTFCIILGVWLYDIVRKENIIKKQNIVTSIFTKKV